MMGMSIPCIRCSRHFAPPMGYPTSSCPFCGHVNVVPVMAPSQMQMGPVVHHHHHMTLQPKCSRTAYVLLGLFLGGLGVHNFVAGYTGRGVAQLLIVIFTGWLVLPLIAVGFWVLIEVIVVSNDSNGIRMS